ncbi:MAG: glycyl-radical enzyme activating protein, partial [Deltaproteobacteria bacterium]
AEVVRDVPFYDESGGGVSFSGGEPLFQARFLRSLLKACGRYDIHRVVDTSGYAAADTFREIARDTDLFLFDLKHMDSGTHRSWTGVNNERILFNFKMLADMNRGVIVRIPLIPGFNDDPDHLRKLGRFISGIRGSCHVDLLPYHDFQKSKYVKFGMTYRGRGIDHTRPRPVGEVAAQLKEFGLHVTVEGEDQ